MRQLPLFLFVIILVSLISCNKTESEKRNDIINFENINKSIVKYEFDSISGTCKNMIFEVISGNQMDFSAILRINSELILCDGYNSILTNSNTGKVVPLNEDFVISETSDWTGIHDLSLDDFAGEGEKYIGYRSCFFPSGIDNFNYGWVKIRLSINKDTLSIISRATNYSNYKSIKAGQIK